MQAELAEGVAFDRERRIGGELELFVVEPVGRGYRPALVTDRLFGCASVLAVPGAGHLSREFHRDMIELNPDPCTSLVEHHRRLRALLREARERLREVHPTADLVGIALNPLKVDPVLRRGVDLEGYARRHVFPDPRYRWLLERYLRSREGGAAFLSMGMVVSYQAEFSCPRSRLPGLFHLGRNLVPAMVAIAANSPSDRHPGSPLSARVHFYRRAFFDGTQPSGIPLRLPESLESYLRELGAALPNWSTDDPRSRVSLDYRWVRLNLPGEVILEPREIDTQPTLAESVALQAAHFGITESRRDHPALASLLDAGPSELERSLGSAARLGLRGSYFLGDGQLPFVELWAGLLELAETNLRRRGRGEERLLAPLWRRLEGPITPAEIYRDACRRRGRAAALHAYVDRLGSDVPLI